MVSFVYSGAVRKLPAAKDYFLEQMENYILGKETDFISSIEDSIDRLEAEDENPKELVDELESILTELLDSPLQPYLQANREALSSFLKRRPDRRIDADNKMVGEARLKNIEEGNSEHDKELIAQLSGTVISDISNITENIQQDILKILRGEKPHPEPTLELQTEIRLKTSKTIQGKNVLSFAKGNNRGNKNCHTSFTFPDDDEMSEIMTKTQDIIIDYTGAEVDIIDSKRGKVIIDSDIDTEGIKGAIEFPVSDIDKFMEKEGKAYTKNNSSIKDGMLLDYEYIDKLNAKLTKWFSSNIGTKGYFNSMVGDGVLYQLLVEASLVNKKSSTGTLSQRVKDTLPDDDDKIKNKYDKFTATKYRIPKAFAINPNFNITKEREYPLIPMKDYKIPKDIEFKEGEDTEEKRKAREKISNKLKQARQEIVAQYNELRSQTAEIEVEGNKYFLIYSDNKDAYNKAEKAYNEFGFGNNKIKTIPHSFFDEKFEMLKQEGNRTFKDKALFASDFQGKERLMYAYIDRKDEPITEAEANQIERGDFRVVEEKYGTTSSGYYFLRKDLLKAGDRAKYVDELGFDEEQRAELYYKLLTGTLDDRTSAQVFRVFDNVVGGGMKNPFPNISEGGAGELGEYDTIYGKKPELRKEDLEDISTEKKMTTKRWLRMYKVNKDVAKIYVLVPELVDSTVSESSRLIEGDEFGETKYQASAFTVEDLLTFAKEEDDDEEPKPIDTELDMKVAYTVYLKKYATYNLSPIRNRGQNKAMRKYLDDLGNRILDIRETLEEY